MKPSNSNIENEPRHQNVFSVSVSATSQARGYKKDQPDQMIEDILVTSKQRQWHFVAKKEKDILPSK